MKRGVLITVVILALAILWCPVLATAQQATAGGKASYKGVANFYSQRFFPVGQVVSKAQQAAQVAAQDATDEETVEVGDAGTTEVTEGQDTTTDVDVVDQVNEGTDAAVTDTDTGNTDTTDAGTTDEVLEANAQDTRAGEYAAVYDEAAGTIKYTGADGTEKTVKIADIGLSAEWLNQLSQTGGIHSVIENEDGSVKLIVGSDDSGAKKWEYDPSARLVAHFEGEAGSEKCTVVTSDEAYNANYIWGSDNAADPGKGPDGHFVVQRFNYDDAGALSTVDYFTWTAGDRQGVDKARYMYRQDTVVQDTTATEEDTTATDDSVTAECTTPPPTCEPKVTTKYFNDPFPVDWDPLLTGTVSKDEYGNYWLEAKDGKSYLLTARVDGMDADKDGKSGADEMNSVDWESMVGKEITVRGHQVNSDSEGGIYKDGKKADIFAVVDLITPEEKTSLGDKYQETVDNMQAVADGVDPVNEGLVGDNAPGELGVINMFNGQMPQAGQFGDDQQIPRLLGGFSNSGLASFYISNIPAETLAAIREFATPELETALLAAEQAAQQAAEQAAQQATTTTGGTQAATTTGGTQAATTTGGTQAATTTDGTQAATDGTQAATEGTQAATLGTQAAIGSTTVQATQAEDNQLEQDLLKRRRLKVSGAAI